MPNYKIIPTNNLNYQNVNFESKFGLLDPETCKCGFLFYIS